MADSVTEQIVREAPDIEAYKLGLMQSASNLSMPVLPDYQVASLSQDQLDAINLAKSGIGAYAPYLQSGATSLASGNNAFTTAANTLMGADTRSQFPYAQNMLASSAQPLWGFGNLANYAGQGAGWIDTAGQGLTDAQRMAMGYGQADLTGSQQMMGDAARMGLAAAQQPGYGAGYGALGMGIGSLMGSAGSYNPYSAQAFMNPYQQQVIDSAIQQIDRQGDIARQSLQAQAVQAGAFGGSREGVQRAELERNLSQTKDQAIINALQQGYGSAQQQAQQAFEQQQQRQMALGQNLGQIGNIYGNMAGQQGQLGLAAAQNYGNFGQNIGAQNLQQAGLGQGAASLYGNLAGQQANLAGMYGNIAAQQAGILGQQSQLQQALGMNMGNLAAQQFGIGQNMASGLGALGTQWGNLGIQQGTLGQYAQQLGQSDVNMLYTLGAQQQQQYQSYLDALRASQMQQAMQPFQYLGFLSDIYKGAPSSQMAVTQQSVASPSPFQQIAGLGTGILGTAAAYSTATGGKLF